MLSLDFSSTAERGQQARSDRKNGRHANKGREEHQRQGREKRLAEEIACNKRHMKRLEDALAAGNTAELLWMDDEVDGHDSDFELSVSQAARVSRQATSVYHFYRLSNDRAEEDLAALEEAAQYGSDDDYNDMPTFLEGARRSVAQLATEAGSMLVPKVCGRTVLRYRRQWVNNTKRSEEGDGYFMLDGRGQYERSWIMEHEDLKRIFTLWMSENSKTMTRLNATAYVNDTLLADEKIICRWAVESYKLSLPIGPSTVLCWMKKCGAKREWFKNSYYNDKHEDPVVIQSRVVYTRVAERLELRQELWALVTKREYFKSGGIDKLQKTQETQAAAVFEKVKSPQNKDLNNIK